MKKRVKSAAYRRLLPALLTMPAAAALSTPSIAQTTAVPSTITVNVFNERHPINPYVYGGNFPGNSDFITKSGTRLCRYGGNIATSTNWKLHIHNTAADWYFENFTDDKSLMDWVKWVQQAGSDAMIGVAMVDWTPKAPETASYTVAKYGPQQKTDPERPANGNGMTVDGKPIKNDPNDAYVPLRDHPSPGDAPGTIYRDEEIKALKAAFGNHAHLYEFDNEPEIWNGTHRDIHLNPPSYDELRDKYLDMANLIRSIDPKGKVGGPTVCGWWFYWNSGAGQADRAAHGGMDYLPWWLGQIADADRKSGRRTLDYFDIHSYPEYASNGTPEETDASILRASRGYWDPTFTCEGWPGTKNDVTATQPSPNQLAIIPRFRSMVNAVYPGTPLAITEWDYHDDNSVAASLADADTYGVFGREKLDIATRFCFPRPDSVCTLALEMYKNFGSTSVEARTDLSPDVFTSYAALSPDGKRLTIMAVNKDPKKSVTTKLNLVGFQPTAMTSYQRAGSDKSITPSRAIAAPASFTFQPYSQTLLVFQGKTATGAVDWSIDKDALMLITGSHATLHVNATDPKGVRIVGIKAAPGITVKARQATATTQHPAMIDVAAGAKPGFYHFTITAKTATGRQENQSGWIVVGAPGSLPVRNGK